MVLLATLLLHRKLTSSYDLVMKPVNIIVHEQIAPGGIVTDYPVSNSGDHGFSWMYDANAHNLGVSLVSNATARKNDRNKYLHRTASFGIQFQPVTNSNAPGGVSFSVDFLPTVTAASVPSGGTATAYAKTYQLDGITAISVSVSQFDNSVTGSHETIQTPTFTWTNSGGVWVGSTYNYAFSVAAPFITEGTATIPGGADASGVGTASYSFTAPTVIGP